MSLFNPNRPGVAVREAYLKTGYADYLLFVEGQALGVVEAKKASLPLTGVEDLEAALEQLQLIAEDLGGTV